MLTLFVAKGTIAVAAGLCVEELGVACDFKFIDFATGDQTKPEYHAINPKGRVPALVLGDTIITETGAILEYLSDTNPDAGFTPSDPVQAAKMREAMFYFASTMHVNHAHKMRGARWADKAESHADMTAKVTENMTASTAYVESILSGPYLLGDTPCLADIYLYAICRWLPGDGVDITQFPKLQAFEKLYAARPAVKRLTERDLP